MSARNFASHFGRKAYNDLDEYDFVKAKHAENLQDLLDRLYSLAMRLLTPCLRVLSWRKWKLMIHQLQLLHRLLRLSRK